MRADADLESKLTPHITVGASRKISRMGMKPEQFLESFVEGNLLDCEERPGDVRRAFNAAVATAHLADQYFNYNNIHNPGPLTRRELSNQFNFPRMNTFVNSPRSAQKSTHPAGSDIK